MKKIVLTPNPYRDRNFKYVTLADKLLREAGLETRICLAFDVDRSFELPDNVVLTELNHELRDADLLVCFGGDGDGDAVLTDIGHAVLIALGHDEALDLGFGQRVRDDALELGAAGGIAVGIGNGLLQQLHGLGGGGGAVHTSMAEVSRLKS